MNFSLKELLGINFSLKELKDVNFSAKVLKDGSALLGTNFTRLPFDPSGIRNGVYC